ncbi:MAG: photoactive yellow protein [Planctomycetota bacterium]
MSFVDQNLISQLPTLNRNTADGLDYGCIKVDDEGNIQLYNKWESDMAGVPVASAEGKNFFTQIAPCTNNRLCFGRFKDGVQSGSLDTEFNYTFTYKMKPTNVVIRLLRDSSNNNWVFVSKRAV